VDELHGQHSNSCPVELLLTLMALSMLRCIGALLSSQGSAAMGASVMANAYAGRSLPNASTVRYIAALSVRSQNSLNSLCVYKIELYVLRIMYYES
jgi:hypothetical protein